MTGRKVLAASAIAAALLVGLTGCGNYATTPEEVKEQAEFVKACHAAGGETFRGTFDNALKCDLDTD